MIGLIVLAAVVLAVVVIVLWVIGVYNGLVGRRNSVKESWAQIDVQLKRRYDLIPNLVETVKGYAKHEAGTLEKVTQARNMAMNAGSFQERAQAENMLTGALKSLFAVAEAYPDLKANQNFLALQEELSSTENRIGFARQFYNDAVMQYNTRIQTVPSNIIAGSFGFTPEPFFAIEDKTERQAPQVKF